MKPSSIAEAEPMRKGILPYLQACRTVYSQGHQVRETLKDPRRQGGEIVAVQGPLGVEARR